MTVPVLSIGTEVVVLTLGKKHGTIVTVGREGRYEVRVERVTMWCRAAALALPPQAKRRKSGVPPVRSVETSTTGGGPEVRLDLHGLRVEEAMTRVLTSMDAAIVRGADRMEIVHGKGEGRLKAALHRQLGTLSVVKAFEVDAHNAGVTWVYF